MSKPISEMTLSEIAEEIWQEQRLAGKPIYYASRPYLEAMLDLRSIEDNYIADSGASIVAYFLSNASTMRGPFLKAARKELNARLKKHYHRGFDGRC